MSTCEAIRSLLGRVAEGEATPDEAIRSASHTAHCTACKIMLARERRLAEMLENNLEDRLNVGDEFVEAVMNTVPQEPPPRSRKKGRRYLKLACFVALLFALPLAAIVALDQLPILMLAENSPASEVQAPVAERAVELLLATGQSLLGAMALAGRPGSAMSSHGAGVAGWVAGAALFTLTLLLMATTLLAVAGRTVAKLI